MVAYSELYCLGNVLSVRCSVAGGKEENVPRIQAECLGHTSALILLLYNS